MKDSVKMPVRFVALAGILAAVGVSLGLAIHSTPARPAKSQEAQEEAQGGWREEHDHPSQITSAAARRAVQRGPDARRIAVKVGDVVPRDHGHTNWHSHLEPAETNGGDPGVLLVRGTFQVAVPNPPQPDHDVPFDVIVQVRKKDTGRVVIDADYIGSGIDRAGMVNWEQTFAAAYKLPRGEYVVEMLLHDPNKRRRKADGTPIGPAVVGLYRRTMTVN